MPRFLRRTAALAATTLLLAACGGGGDDAGDDTNYDAAAAWGRLLTAGPRGWTAGVSSGGQSVELRIGVAPVAGSDIRFPVSGTAARRTDIAASVRINGATFISGTTELYFETGSLRVLGTVNPDDTSCGVATVAILPPAQTRIGNGGRLFELDERAGCSPTSPRLGRTIADWSIVRDLGTTYFCLTQTLVDNANVLVAREQECVETAPNGSLGNRSRISLLIPGELDVTAYGS